MKKKYTIKKPTSQLKGPVINKKGRVTLEKYGLLLKKTGVIFKRSPTFLSQKSINFRNMKKNSKLVTMATFSAKLDFYKSRYFRGTASWKLTIPFLMQIYPKLC